MNLSLFLKCISRWENAFPVHVSVNTRVWTINELYDSVRSDNQLDRWTADTNDASRNGTDIHVLI